MKTYLLIDDDAIMHDQTATRANAIKTAIPGIIVAADEFAACRKAQAYLETRFKYVDFATENGVPTFTTQANPCASPYIFSLIEPNFIDGGI